MKKIFVIADSYGTIIEARETKAQATKRAKEMDNPEKGVFFTASPANLCGISIFGRRHLTKTYGNTEHTAHLTLFFDDGRTYRHKTPKIYGYGEQYLYTALEHAAKMGFLPSMEDAHFGYFRSNAIGYTAQAVDVATAKEL